MKFKNIINIKNILQLTKPIRYFFDALTFNFSKNKKNLKNLKGAIKGKPLLIVGNGPSINNTPLDKFSNTFSIGMNKIDMIFKKTTWRPDYIIATNTLVIKQHWEKMINTKIPTFLSWKSRFFIPLLKRNKFSFFLNDNNSDFKKDISNSVGVAGTVTYTALQFAHYLEANPVIIVGVDHNFAYEGKPNEYKLRKGDDINHFDPNYFADGQYWGLPNLDLSEVGYKNAKKIFNASNLKIYDATIDGKLNIFEKISIEEALDMVNGSINE